VCAIRDAQLNEKHQIKKDIKNEDKRMDMMMELNRVNSIKIQEEIEKKRKQDLMKYDSTFIFVYLEVVVIKATFEVLSRVVSV
jgi:hypothetical protein